MSALARELGNLGASVVVVAASWSAEWPRRIVVGEVPVVRIPHAPRGGWNTFRYARALTRWLRQHQTSFDVVYALGLRHEAYAAIQALQKSAVRVVLGCLDAGALADSSGDTSKSMGARMRQCRAGARAIVVPWPETARQLQASGYGAGQVRVIAPGRPVPKPRSADRRFRARAALADANRDLAVAEYAPVTVFAGRLSDLVALSNLVTAWRNVALRWPSARLWLVGDGPARSALYDHIAALDLHGQVLMPGSFETLSDVWLAADACVSPLPACPATTLLDAMAAGLPIVAAYSSVAERFVRDQQTGLLVPPQHVPAWTEALTALWDEPTRTARMGVAARQTVIDQFPVQAMARAHLALFNELA
ncbi:MAG: glycosyltransferase family 4 protein [Pirellulaceae bacterium]